jgi:hypothetical protein
MGIFDWMIRKEEATEQTVGIYDLNNQIYLLKKRQFSDVYKEFERYSYEMKKLFNDLEVDAAYLANAQINPAEVDVRILVRLNSAKENLANRIIFLCRNYREKIAPISSFTGINVFLELTAYTIDELNKTAKYSEMAAVGFKREVNNIAGRIRRAIEIYKYAQKRFDESGIASFETLENTVKSLYDLLNYRKKIEMEVDEQRKEIENEKARLAAEEEEGGKIEHSKEFKGAKDLMQRTDEIEDELRELKITLRNKFVDFSKAVSKAKYGPSFNADEKKLMDLYLAEPLDALDKDPAHNMNKILEKIGTEVEAGTISLDERMKLKTLKSISRFLKGDELKIADDEKYDLLEEMKMFEEEIKKSGIHNFHTIDVAIKNSKKRIKDIEAAIEVQQELLKKNQAGIEQIKGNIVEGFGRFGVILKIE